MDRKFSRAFCILATGAAVAAGGCSKINSTLDSIKGNASSSSATTTTTAATTTAASTTTPTTTTTTAAAGPTTLAATGSAIRISVPNTKSFDSSQNTPTSITFAHSQTIDANNNASATATFTTNGGSGAGSLTRQTGINVTIAVQGYNNPTGPDGDTNLVVMRDAGSSRLTDMSYGITTVRLTL